MSTVFFKIGTTDLSAYVNKQGYVCNKLDDGEEWQDANWTTHRVIARQRVTGKFDLGFSRSADFASAVSLLASGKGANGTYSVTCYINNTGSSAAITAFLDVTGETGWDEINSRYWFVLHVELTEA